jgi:ATP-dependent helicase/nuclease subunit B
MTLPSDEPAPLAAGGLWHALAQRVRAWAGERGLPLRDVVVLLPYAQLLGPARDAYAATEVWMPRIETTRTLRASLGPAPVVPPGSLRLDPAVDELAATRRLADLPGRWRASIEPATLAPEFVDLAHAFARVAGAWPPATRDDQLARVRRLLAPQSGPGGDERELARAAFDWARASPLARDDALWSLRPAGWVVVRAGGPDPLAEALAAAGHAATLVIDLDAEAGAALDAGRLQPATALITCAGFEDEAQAAAAEIIAMLQDGLAPVALIAQDRVLTRRIRALLEQSGVALADETGWRLSTTRAAARLTALLDLAFGDPGTDTLLDATKSLADWQPGREWARGVEWLEVQCRRHRLTRRAQLATAGLDGAAAAVLHALDAAIAPLAELGASGAALPAAWLDALASALRRAGAWDAMAADDAGRAVIDALGLEPLRGAGPALRSAPVPLDAAAFRHAIDRWLDTASFVPPSPSRPEVVVLPLERAVLRSFAGVVFPGADERQLGGPPPAWPWLADRLAGELGLATQVQRQQAQWSAMLHVLRFSQVTFLHRRLDAGESIGPSRWIERIELARQRHGREIERRTDRRETVFVTPAPVEPGGPVATRLPPLERLSATAAEALRECPYRYFALQRLRLAEERELDGEIERNDFGNWAHRVLHRFHAERGAPSDAATEVARWVRIAEEVRAELGLDEAGFVPFGAGFAALAPRYVEWLHRRDAEGWVWRAGEQRHETRPPALGGVLLYGDIDRIDARGAERELIDYKTGSVSKLREKLSNRFEDTQLAFYAALVGADGDAGMPVSARYLGVGKAQKLEPIEHKDVAASAAALVRGLGDELARIAAGAPLRPLGEGPSCEYCAARGRCRRDHWWQRP